MNKAWLVSSFLGIVTLGVIGATSTRHSADFHFLDGAQNVVARDVCFRKDHPTHVEAYNLHVPYDAAWAQAQAELCDQKGWQLGTRNCDSQNFNLGANATVCLIRGRVDDRQDFIDGTEGTDTYVVVRRGVTR